MRRDTAAIGVRLSFFYGATFTVVGLQLPFWPLWLQGRGLSPAEIGVLLAAPMWIRVVGNPLVASLVDRLGDRRRPMIALAAGAVAAFGLFRFAEGFWTLLAITMAYAFLFSPLAPLGDSLALMVAREKRLDYGRLRLWGSISFVAAAFAGGALLVDRPPVYILVSILAAIGLTLLGCFVLPRYRPPEGGVSIAITGSLALARQPVFQLFLLAAGLIQASHAVMYGFGSLYWRAAGLGGDVIGELWAVGVIAEIALFAFSDRIVGWIGPARLLVLAGAGGVVRWLLLASTVDPYVLFPAQVLHGLTFGAAHLGAMHFLARAVPVRMSARGQVLYSAVAMGIAFGLTMPLAGAAYDLLQGHAFVLMAGLALVGLLAALRLDRRWRGGLLAS